MIGSLVFLHPWILAGLLALPALWYLLRVTPPPPRVITFPPARLLAGLSSSETTASRTPWWLLLLRLLCLAFVITGLAGPVLHPAAALPDSGPVRLVIDNGWASAQVWDAMMDEAGDLARRAARGERPVFLLTLAARPGDTAPQETGPLSPAEISAALRSLAPSPWPVDLSAAATAARQGGSMDSYWIGSGLQEPATRELAAALQAQGPVTVYGPSSTALPLALRPALDLGNNLGALAESAAGSFPPALQAQATGSAGKPLSAAPVGKTGHIAFDLPPMLRNQAQAIRLAGRPGAVLLFDDRFRRRAVGIAGNGHDSDAQLTDAVFYLRAALTPTADVTVAPIQDLLKRQPVVIILPDIGGLPVDDLNRLEAWVRGGGLLLRFAGPAMTQGPQALTPTPLVAGDRASGGAMSWAKPQEIAPFPPASPLYGLPAPPEVTVSRQVLAAPQPGLGQLTWASLADGTPLITARPLDRGLLVLVHTTATPQWSNFALSGLFVQTLQRIVALAGAPVAATVGAGGALQPRLVLDGYGRLQPPAAWVQPLSAQQADGTPVGPHHPPGYYGEGGRQVALNLGTSLARLAPLGDLPSGVERHVYGEGTTEVDLMPRLLLAAFALFLLDWLAMLLLRSRLAAMAGTAIIFLCLPLAAHAAGSNDASAAADFHLAYVTTGDATLDGRSAAGLTALAATLNQRTSVDAAGAVAIDPAQDDLSFFPLLYWPVAANAAALPSATAQRVQAYLDHGGTILFDTGDQTSAVKNTSLQLLTGGLNISPLVPVPQGHVLTKAFYLLRDFPARYDEGTVWVEEASAAGRDNVSSVIVADHDWAGGWNAAGDTGEMDRRFGVNLVLYALTGNYKNDQVHLAHILERLGEKGTGQ